MLPTGKLIVENDRLRERIEAFERLAAQSRLAAEAREADEEREWRAQAEQRREAEVLGASLALDSVLHEVAAGARERCGGDVVGIGLREPGSDAVVFRHFPDALEPSTRALRVTGATGIAAQVLSTGRPFRCPDYAGDPSLAGGALVAGAGTIRALMAAPIRVQDRIEGLIYVGNTTTREFTDGDVLSLQRVADHVGGGIQSARQFGDNRRTADELALFYTVTQAMEALPARAPMMSALFGELTFVLHARRMLVLLHDGARREFDVIFDARTEGPAAGEADTPTVARPPWGLDLARTVMERRAPLRTSAYEEHALGVPFGTPDPIGVLVLWTQHRPFSRDDQKLLQGVAPLLALALRSS